MNCPSCKSDLPAGVFFCSHCGLPTTDINSTTLRNDPQDTSEVRDPLLGVVLDSKYELLERLGEGGMGAVYRARRRHIGDEVAVKVLPRKMISNTEAVERFRREARSAAMIRHANVVTIHDFGEAKSSDIPAYIVMELVKGTSLRNILAREGRLTLERAAALMRDVCTGVGLAHRQGVIHRDLKPDNVIVVPPTVDGERETAKVVDFGLARLQETNSDLILTQSGAMMGSPFYMSPEQCRAETIDERADVYSLGAMLYEMLAGWPPFRADNVAELIAQHLTARVPSLPANSGIPRAVDELCQRALSKNPEHRPRDANDFDRQLQSALATAPLSNATFDAEAGRVTLPVKTPQPVRSKTYRPAIVIGALAMLMVGAVVVVAAIAIIGSKYMNRDGVTAGSNVTSPSPTTAVSEGTPESNSQPGDGNLAGEWKGKFGPMNNSASLVIKEAGGGKLSGILTQGSIRVAVEGNYDRSSRRITLKETHILVGSDWILGENTGELSADGRKMSGTGHDSMGGQFGIAYQWSFERR